MASVVVASPVPAAAFKSPLRSIASEAFQRGSNEDLFADSRVRLTQWRKDLSHAASLEAQHKLHEACQEKEQLKDLQADLAGVQGLVAIATQLQAGGERFAEVLQKSSEAAGSRAEVAARICTQLTGLCEARREELRKIECENTRKLELADAQHSEALKLLNTYKERLGLEITRIAPQTVRMTFSLLDDRNLDREFAFTLGLESRSAVASGKTSDSYCVCSCEPEVPDVPRLLAILNADVQSRTALPQFVCSMRREFIKLAQGTNAA